MKLVSDIMKIISSVLQIKIDKRFRFCKNSMLSNPISINHNHNIWHDNLILFQKFIVNEFFVTAIEFAKNKTRYTLIF